MSLPDRDRGKTDEHAGDPAARSSVMTDVHDEHWALKEATASAAESPCAKSKRGVVLWDPYHPSKVFCRGVNAPAFGQCTEDEACRARCNKLCIHAEADAILGCESFDLWRCHLLHVKVVDGVAVPSGPPSCASCSALIVRAGIESVWLLHEDGLRKYDAAEFHRLSVAHNPLAGLYVKEAVMKKPSWTLVAIVLIMVLLVGYVVGREHVKYEVRNAFKNAFKGPWHAP